MAFIEQAIYSIVSGDADISAVVSTRIYPNVAPQSAALPYITYQKISAYHDQATTNSTGLANGVFQINCWSDDYDELKDLTEKVRLALQAYSPATVAGCYIAAVHLLDERDAPSDPEFGQDIGVFGTQSDFRIWFNETIPTRS